jgi:hypothetical protein
MARERVRGRAAEELTDGVSNHLASDLPPLTREAQSRKLTFHEIAVLD